MSNFFGDTYAEGDCYSPVFDVESGKSLLVCRSRNCDYRTDKYCNFKRHYDTMHLPLGDGRGIVCCDISFVTKGDYRHHSRTTHYDGHRCPLCGKKFNRKALLLRHMPIHTGSKPFRCHLCPYGSPNKANVARHMSTHRPDVDADADANDADHEHEHVSSSSSSSASIKIQELAISSTTADKSLISHSIESILRKEGDWSRDMSTSRDADVDVEGLALTLQQFEETRIKRKRGADVVFMNEVESEVEYVPKKLRMAKKRQSDVI